jgi:hypothetical protein
VPFELNKFGVSAKSNQERVVRRCSKKRGRQNGRWGPAKHQALMNDQHSGVDEEETRCCAVTEQRPAPRSQLLLSAHYAPYANSEATAGNLLIQLGTTRIEKIKFKTPKTANDLKGNYESLPGTNCAIEFITRVPNSGAYSRPMLSWRLQLQFKQRSPVV